MELISNNSYHYVDVCISCVYAGVDGLDLVLKGCQQPSSSTTMQPTRLGPKTRWDLGCVTQLPSESLRDYIKRYFANPNTIMEVDDGDVIYHFHQGLHSIELWRKMFENNPKTISDMMAVINKLADMEDAERAHHRHKDRRDPVDRPHQRDDDSARPGGDRLPRDGKNRDRAESSKAPSASADPTTPSPSPIGPNSAPPLTRRSSTGSSTPSAPGTRTPTTR